MRSWSVVVLVVVALCGHATSQSYVAVAMGFPTLFSVHLGFQDLLGPAIDVRANLGGAALWAGGGAVFGVAAGADVLARAPSVPEARWIAYGGAGAGIMGLGFLGGADSGARFAPHVSGIGGVELLLADTRVFLEARGELVLPIGDPMFGFLGGRIGVKFPLEATVATGP